MLSTSWWAVGIELVLSMAILWWLLGDLRVVPRTRSTRPDAPTVAAVIPARDEATVLPALLASLRTSRTPLAQVVVVDDGSSDATAAIARAAGATVLSIDRPPPGWTGKAWACQRGAQLTDADLLLFLDADTTLDPDALGGLITLHEQHGGLVSVQPFHVVVRAYEQLSAYFNAMSLLATAAFARRGPQRAGRAGSTSRTGPATAFGPCLLTSRADYERVGGHAAVRGEILDDVRLAAVYAGAGLPVRCWAGGDAIAMRSYPDGPRQLVSGWTKNFASGATATALVPTLAAAAWICVHHAVGFGAVLALLELATGWRTPITAGDPAMWALAWVVVAWQLRTVLRRLGSFRWWAWAFFPVGLVVFDLVFARSVGLTVVRRSVRWRGREVAVGSRARARAARAASGESA